MQEHIKKFNVELCANDKPFGNQCIFKILLQYYKEKKFKLAIRKVKAIVLLPNEFCLAVQQPIK